MNGSMLKHLSFFLLSGLLWMVNTSVSADFTPTQVASARAANDLFGGRSTDIRVPASKHAFLSITVIY